MSPYLDKVSEFHRAFGAPINNEPKIDDIELNALRVGLIQEELDELKQALLDRDKVDALDALCDLAYVLNGAILSLGYASVIEDAFNEVHASNMSKLDANGNPVLREDGKILKGPNYFKPNLGKFIKLPL